MSAELSRRMARVAKEPPIFDLSFADRRALSWATRRADTFTDLTAEQQRLILDAEAAREAAIAAKRQAMGTTA